MLKPKDEFLFKYKDKKNIKTIIVRDKGNDASYDVLESIRSTLRYRYRDLEIYRRVKILFYRSKWKRFYSIEDLIGEDI